MLRFWTIGRATGIGIVAGLAALLLWPMFAAWPDVLLWPFVIVLAVTALCGVSILLITMRDIYHRRRGAIIHRIRIFDAALGLLLAVPSLFQLEALLAP